MAAGVWPGVDYCVLWPLASRGEIITNIGFIADTRGVTGESEVKTHGNMEWVLFKLRACLL